MITESLSTLKIHKLSQSQYDRELNAGRIDENAIYLTPEEEITLLDLGVTATASELNKMDGVTATTTELNYCDGVTSNIQTQLNNLQTQIDTKQTTVTGAATTITNSNLTTSRALISNSSGKVAVSPVTSTELSYLDGVTSAIQTQLDGKQSTVTGGASTITGSNLTTNRALVSNSSGKVAVSAVTSTELGYLDGVTSNVQTQLNGKANTSHNHSASEITSGTLSVSRGGTGKTSLTSGSYLVGNGTSAVALKTPSQVLSDIGAASSEDLDALADKLTRTQATSWNTAKASYSFSPYMYRYGDIRVMTISLSNLVLNAGKNVLFTINSDSDIPSTGIYTCGFAYNSSSGSTETGTPVRLTVGNNGDVYCVVTNAISKCSFVATAVYVVPST